MNALGVTPEYTYQRYRLLNAQLRVLIITATQNSAIAFTLNKAWGCKTTCILSYGSWLFLVYENGQLNDIPRVIVKRHTKHTSTKYIAS